MPVRTLLLAFVFAGCEAETPSAPVTPEPAAVQPGQTEPAAVIEPSPSAPDVPVPDSAPALLALDSEGLRFVNAESGSTRLLAFESDGEQAVAAVARLRGAPGQRGTNGECGAGPLDIASWPDGFSLLLSDGRFVGWAANETRAGSAGRPATTMAGLGVGSTRTDLDGAYTARITESTLGTEFEAGDLYGVLDGPGPDARVTALWAGVSCVFR